MKNDRSDAKKLVFSKDIKRWDEAVPLGNGICGALIWGSSEGLRFSLDRNEIWDNTRLEGTYTEEYTYETMVKLARESKNEEIRRIFDAPYNHVCPTKLTAGKLIVDFGAGKNVCSELDLTRAEAKLLVGENIQVESFLHACENVGMIRVNPAGEEFSFRVENPAYGVEGVDVWEEESCDSVNTASLKKLIYPAPEIVSEEKVTYFIQQISPEFSYGIFAMRKEQEGSAQIAYTVCVSTEGELWKESALKRVEAALERGYEDMLVSHLDWWDQYWGKSSICVPDPLFQKNWNLAQYFLASCSRKGGYPMPLQGLWTADDGMLPPWKGDYHFDLNVQMSYYSYLKANHVEEGEVLIDYLWSLTEKAREFAKRFYGSKGLCLPSVMTITGEALGGWAMYALSPTNQIWTSQLMERHYRFTGDRKFLEEKAYPYLEETGAFILGLLEKRDGKYYLPISSSPEIHDDSPEAFLTPNSNYDLGLMRYLFSTLARLSGELGNGKEPFWKEQLACLPELAVNEEGVLMLSPDEELKESHRHFSHVMSIHPLRLLPYEGEENRRIIDATVDALEGLGSGWWVGYSFPWMAEIYAIQKNGNGAAKQLELFWENFCSPNGFHLNGDYKKRGLCIWHYRPFTLEGNFGAADALQEMLLQREDNVLELFPAIPEEWLQETVAFTDLCAEKGLLVSAVMEKGKVTSVTLKPRYSGKVYIKWNEDNIQELDLLAGQERSILCVM